MTVPFVQRLSQRFESGGCVVLFGLGRCRKQIEWGSGGISPEKLPSKFVLFGAFGSVEDTPFSSYSISLCGP